MATPPPTPSSVPVTPRSPLWAPTYRLLAYCVVVGVIGGVAAIRFEHAVELAQRLLLSGVGHYTPPRPGVLPGPGETPTAPPGWPQRWWLPVATTLGGLLSGWVVYRWAPEAEGHGTDAAISAYHSRGGEVRARTPLVKAVASALTIGSGGVAGREGPTAQIAVGLGGVVARLARLRGQERRILLLASMAAGLAAMFQAPLGMAIFSVEILYSAMVFESEALIYTVISAVTAGAARTPISTLIMVAEMTGGYELIVPAMLANTVAFVVQRTLTHGRRYPTLYEHQVPTREDSAAHRGVFVRRALQMLEGEAFEPADLTLPRLVSLLRFGEPIPVTETAGMLVAIEVAPGSELDGVTVADSIGRMEGATAVALLREEEMTIARRPTRIEAGDQVIAIARREAYEALRRAAGAVA